ncbi:nuclear transport factor 2 family protein [Sphingomonas sp. PAMC 26605]|uniref:nuclear transport factor 2 family protein n=1 Tax=Sphingomonas sp. PAMC 26605 TaxID=1112214 RepID=UPI00026CB1C8
MFARTVDITIIGSLTREDLQRPVAIEDIRNLQARYVRLADGRDWQGLSHLFLPNAAFTV